MTSTNETGLKRTLTLWQVVFLGMAWNTPMIYFSVYGVAVEGASGYLTPAYTLAVLAVLLTGASYAVMAKKIPISGSAYTFAKKAIHPNVGFLVGWVLLLNYLFAPIIAAITFGIFLGAQFPAVPTFAWVALLVGALAFIAIMGIRSSANVSRVIVLSQLVFLVAFMTILVVQITQGTGAGTLLSTTPFLSPELTIPMAFAGASVVVFSFLGFDTMTTLSEETIDSKKTIPRAIFIMIGIVGTTHVGISYFGHLAYPAFTFANPDSAAMELMMVVGGSALSAVFITVLIAAIFAQGLASVTAASRLLFVMGRDEILPKQIFAKLHPTRKTPVNNIIIISVLSFGALFIPLDTAMLFVNFGALTTFLFVNLSVINLYLKEKTSYNSSFAYQFANLYTPLCGAGFMMLLIFMIDPSAIMVGLAWTFAGVVYLLYMTNMFSKPLPQISRKKTARVN
ncbi:APC family permease [Alkalicoccus chagannorensis]|uniref:APC family permease n=1 Tax=Alkalicoccus chagannorensis TaxID=427072 RepID=UPI00042976EF|nr:APC family permease [Alkalicoccus chagannorensis]